MKNKKIFKNVYQEKLNKDKNYEEIIKRLNNKKTNETKYYKFANVCLIAIISFSFSLLFISKTNSIHQLNNDKNKDIININKIDTTSDGNNFEYPEKAPIYDEISDLADYLFIRDVFDYLDLPSDFKKDYTIKTIYTNNQKINHYESLFQNSNGTRSIVISFSKENKPLNRYASSSNVLSKINGVELIIYYRSDYIAEFYYKDINYLIETKNITEDELIKILKSIIK